MSPLNPHPFSPAVPVSNERRAKPRARTSGEWMVVVLSVLGGLIAIAVVALVLL